MRFTSFLGRCTTSRIRHGEYLFQGEFLGFHSDIIATVPRLEMLNIAHFQHISQSGRFHWVPLAVFSKCEQK